MLSVAEQFLEQQMHPTVIISAYRHALDDMLDMLKDIRYRLHILTHLLMNTRLHSLTHTHNPPSHTFTLRSIDRLSLFPPSTPVDVNDRAQMLKIINSAICTKALSRWSTMACNIALDAVRTVELEEHGRKEINIKLYAKVEKVKVLQLQD